MCFIFYIVLQCSHNRRSRDTLYYYNNPWLCHYIKNTVRAAYVISVDDLLYITVTSLWALWPLESLASPLFTQPFIQEQIKENINAPRYWPLCGDFTGDRLIPRTNGQLRRKCFHKMTSSWDNVLQQEHNGLCCHPSWCGSIYMFNTFVGNYISNQSRIKPALAYLVAGVKREKHADKNDLWVLIVKCYLEFSSLI